MLQNLLSKIRRTIHSNPELAYKEHKTSRFVISQLRKWGIEAELIGGTGVLGFLKAKDAGQCIALRADMDALPIKTQIKKQYASKITGVMHACGHDANTAILLGCAYLLKNRSRLLKKNVKFIFQPAEETANGADSLIKLGVLDNPKVDVILGVHVNPGLKVGTVGLKKGVLMSAVDRFSIRIFGGGGHGAYPHLGRDSILAAAQFVTAVQAIVSRQIDPLDPVVISICRIMGGDRFNVLADRVEIEGTVRTLKESLRKSIPSKIKRVLRSIAGIYNLKTDFDYENLGRVLVNDEVVTNRLINIARKLKEIKKIDILKNPSMGGEDFAEYLEHVRGCFIYVGSKSGKSTGYPWHHPKFDIDEKALSVGAETLARMAVEY